MTTGKDAILACMTRIETSYTFVTAGSSTGTVGKLQFDAVMITHWDVDHWGGIRDLIRDSIAKYLKKRTDLDTLVTTSDSNNDHIKGLRRTVTGLQVPIFKYGAAEPASIFQAAGTALSPVAPATLQTTFYVPYVTDTRPGRLRLASAASDFKKAEDKVDNSGQSFICNRASDYKNGQFNTMGALGSFNYKIGNAAQQNRAFKFFDLCKLVAYYEDYLGVEVFYGKTLPAGTYKSIRNPGQLIKAHNLTSSVGPRMYIVAGDQVILGGTPLAASNTVAAPVPKPKTPPATPPTSPVVNANAKFASIRGRVDIVDDKDTSLGTRVTGLRAGPEAMNSPSIACLIISSTTMTPTTITAAQEGTSWRLWHYMVGTPFSIF